MERRVQLDAGLSQVGLREVRGRLPGCSTRYAVTGVAPPDLDLDQITAMQPLDSNGLKTGSNADAVLGALGRVDMRLRYEPWLAVRGGDRCLMLCGNSKLGPRN